MTEFNEGLKLLDQKFGNGKDNLLALATISRELNDDGKVCPNVRCVDAYYENATFYVVTNAKSNKMQDIEQNPEVSIAFCSEKFNASATGENKFTAHTFL